MSTVIFSPALSKLRLCCRKINRLPQLSVVEFFYLNHSNLKMSSSNMESKRNCGCDQNIFQGKKDVYHGVTVHSEKEKVDDVKAFTKKLEDSLEFWKENNYRGIWFRVHLDQSEWVSILAKKGFKFHHAEDDHVMMNLWLPQTENYNIPHYAHNMVGVGAVVVNEKSQVLAVMEKYSRTKKPSWKLPGGYVDKGENLVDAAIREVHEETGISTQFHSLLSIRHMHRGMFGCSDIYVVFSLKPLTDFIEKCDRELAACKWMDIEEYMTNPDVSEHNRFFVRKHLEYEKHNIKINCFHGLHTPTGKPNTIYSIVKKDVSSDKDADCGNNDKDD